MIEARHLGVWLCASLAAALVACADIGPPTEMQVEQDIRADTWTSSTPVLVPGAGPQLGTSTKPSTP
jgi:hypothetical protein